MKRLLLAALLLLPLSAEPKLERFESSVKDYEKRDQVEPVKAGGTVFVGSSTFALWAREPEREFKEFAVINRGFGGSTLPELNHYRERLVYAYKPRLVLVYCGTNDLAEGRKPAQLVGDFREFVQATQKALPETRIGYVALSLPPSRVHLRSEFAEANKLLREECARQSRVDFVDVSRLVEDAQGEPREELFREDRLHMKPEGYALWIPFLRNYLKSASQ